MLVYFTTSFRFPGSMDWSGQNSGTNVHLRGFYGSILLRIGLNLNGVNIFFEFPVINCYDSVWLSILIPKSK
jgi:hypothetical protein